ncbi:3-phytase A [Grifola frondosa]|uniref:Phytase A n=1 Tax=Grifola frondosa TaxID=5627 RepID=A0A1C7M4Z3_GRIFR|nr:3-phytase A [Grifola frondosa]
MGVLHKIPALPVVNPQAEYYPLELQTRNSITRAQTSGIRVSVAVIIFLCYAAWMLAWFGDDAHGGNAPLGVPKYLQRRWGQYAPWYPNDEYEPPPFGCNITQLTITIDQAVATVAATSGSICVAFAVFPVNIKIKLQRHGARYPNAEDGAEYFKAIQRLISAEKFKDSRLEFLLDYEYELGEDDLVPFGAAQSFDAGKIAYERYVHLVNPGSVPFVRASGVQRVISTATNWTVGFAAASRQRYNPALNVILSEEVNNTLNNDCPNAGDGSRQTGEWVATFAPPHTTRLNKAAPGANLTDMDVYYLLAMCPFETVAKETASPFCDLFTKNDFRAFEYFGDLEKYYKTGYGEPLGPIQGVGYVNELLARLTDTPVRDHTQANSSLDFPLGRTIYADFTHENTMIAIYSAIGLFNISAHPPDPRDISTAHEGWIASHMVPFSARMVTERMECALEAGMGGADYVRILVNDDVQPLEFCGARENGLCTLDAFVESQGYARRSGDGDFEKCYN